MDTLNILGPLRAAQGLEEKMGYWGAFWRGVRMGLGLPVEPIDYSPEAQLVRLAKRLEESSPPDDAAC